MITDRDNGYKALMSMQGSGPVATVGIHDDAGSYNGISIAEVAAIHEFGLNGIERSFLRAYIDANESEIEGWIRQAATLVVTKRIPRSFALNILGAKIAAGVRGFIQSGSVQPRSGSGTTLIDTGALVGAITHKVES